MAEERRRIEAESEEKCRELTEQYARDRQDAEQKNTKLIEQMSTLHSHMANMKAERRTSGISLANYNKEVQENRSEFLTCVQNLAKVKTPNWSIGLVGRTSAGKSSLLNRMFGTTCKVGATRCTTGVEEVWRCAHPDIHKGISVWDVFGFNDEEAYESIETIKKFVSLHAVLLLYRDDIQSCKNTIELFRAADVKVIVVRSQIDTLTREELQEIEQVEAPIAKEYGACHWTKTTTKSGTSADELKEYILSLDVKADDIKKNGIYWYRDGRNGVEKEVQVVAIDRTVKPPSFTIRVDERDIETEAHRLSLHKSSLSAADDIKKDGPVMSPQDAQCLGLDRMRLADGHFQMFQYDQALPLYEPAWASLEAAGDAPASLGAFAPGSCVAASVYLATVEEWSPEQVGEFVGGLTADFGVKAGLYAEKMVQEDVNGRVLLTLNDVGMKGLGVSLGHRRLLAQRIASFASNALRQTVELDMLEEHDLLHAAP